MGGYGPWADVGLGKSIRLFGLFEHDYPLKCNNAGFFSISLKLSKFLLACKEGKSIQDKYSLLVILQKDNVPRKCPVASFSEGSLPQCETVSHPITGLPWLPEVAHGCIVTFGRRMEIRPILPPGQPVKREHFIVVR